MKYLDSALKFLPETNWINSPRITVLQWSVGIIYFAAMSIIFTWQAITYPGYASDGSEFEYMNWLKTTFRPLMKISNTLWLTLSFASIGITVFAINTISRGVKKLAN